VVLAGLEDGLFPLARAEDQPGGVEEERRLCYVGITRARDMLYLSWARARRRGGELRPGMASRFLKALPPDMLRQERTSSMFSMSGYRRDGGMAGGRYERNRWSGSTSGSGYSKFFDEDNDGASSRRPAVPAEETSQDAPRYVRGERVKHRRFGSGTIKGLIGAGRDLKVEVAFDDAEAGTKQLLVAYAGLERDWEGE
jgi:DNA helicase-2/ATP-dependent DNA helicase PcrA